MRYWSFFFLVTFLLLTSGCIEEPDVEVECSLDDPLPCPDGQVCVQGRCEEGLDEGDSCAIGGPATGATPCKEGLTCREDGSGDTTCQPSASQGTMCTLDADCGENLVCRRRTPGADTTCETPAAFGAYCDTTEDCEDGLECVADGTSKSCS